jgi:HlyD family secretion protein
MKRAVIVLLVVVAIGAGAGAYYLKRGGSDISVVTAPITRGDIVDTVGATGTLQAVTTVQVGSQVSGNISFLGADFNSIVKKNQVVARLDPALFQAAVDQGRANLAKAQADVAAAQANVEHAQVALTDAQQKYTRAKELAAKQLLAQADLDAAKIALDSAQSALESSKAALTSSKAVVGQSQANLNQAQVNLEHTVITAPVDGIVTQRSVDVGQTVAASMQAPTLFIIAADLTKMQVSANIDEADIGRIRPGQRATFHVDAYPTDTFQGAVAQIRLQPVVVQNVTTYATMINVSNTDLRLKPGMTANLKIEVARKSDVLRVPNTAIRFRPTAEIFAALNQAVPPELTGGGRGGRRGQNAQGGGGSAGAPAASATAGVPAASSSSAALRTSRSGADTGGGAPSGWQGGGGSRGGDPAQRLERFKAMTPEQQQQMIARMKDRGIDTSAFEAALAKPANGRGTPAKGGQASSALQSAQTIDALFAPLPTVESRGRLWIYVDKQIKPVNVRLGITDGTFTELVGGDLQDTNTQVVTGVNGISTRPQPAGAGGNPFQGGGGRGFGGGRF